jgi:hypothetical protein
MVGFSGTATFTLTNNPGDPLIASAGGTPQSAAVNVAFPSRLLAKVTDNSGKALFGIPVKFVAPTGANVASGTFAGGASTATVNTDSNGIATAPVFTANGTRGSYVVSATGPAGVLGTATFQLTNMGPPASITAAAGTPQSTGIGNPFAGALVARVTDGPSGSGNPVQGVTVTFKLNPAASGASGLFAGGLTTATAVTDGTGAATSPMIAANTTSGAYTVTASVAGVAQNATFNLTNTGGGGGTLLPGNQTIRQNDSVSFRINLPTPAPSGGIIVSLASTNPSIVTVSPANILIPAGSTTSRGSMTLNAISVGSAQITATAYGFVPDSAMTVTVIAPLPQ